MWGLSVQRLVIYCGNCGRYKADNHGVSDLFVWKFIPISYKFFINLLIYILQTQMISSIKITVELSSVIQHLTSGYGHLGKQHLSIQY